MKKACGLIISLCTLSFCLQACVPALVAGAGAAALGTNSAKSNLSLGTQFDDTAIKTKANAVLNNYPQLVNNSNVEISVFDGVVLLLGQVPEQTLKDDLANDMAAINGVRTVYNQLQVGPTIAFSQYARDTWITTRVTTKFLGNVDTSHFKVVTENGVVFILGVCTEAEGDVAAQLASEVPGVNKVVTAYSFLPPPAPAVVESSVTTDASGAVDSHSANEENNTVVNSDDDNSDIPDADQ